MMTRIVAHSCRPLQTNPFLQRDVGVDTVRLQIMAGTGFAGATELLEQLVTETGIEFRRLKRVLEQAVALSIQAGEVECVTYPALRQALQDEGLDVALDPETVRQLQDPGAILAEKQVVGGPGRQALTTELEQLAGFYASQQCLWDERRVA